MARSSTSIKPNLSLHNIKVIAPYWKWINITMVSYIVKVNAKYCLTYGDLYYSLF